MNDIVICARGIGKRYAIGAARERYRTIRESLAETAKRPLRTAARLCSLRRARGEQSEFWALRNIALEVRRGEVLGVIGCNGAGKSTLLKVLSRITEPTEGWAEITGRVASLLEVGTGFHQELTGRENIYLNGAILGMKRKEIGEKFDEIVAFAEVEPFIDTPVKHYSSGMAARLGYAVAFEAVRDVLILDEIFAVGDAGFRAKCEERYRELRTAGHTVLLVSHDPRVVTQFCERAILLEAGRVAVDGPASLTAAEYLTMVPFVPGGSA